MPAPMIAIPNGSGFDAQGTIQKLLEVERIPFARMNAENQTTQVLVEAWEELRNRTRKLSDASRNLHSFAGPFATRSIVSSDPGAITGAATSKVEDVTQQIEVVRLASRHQIHSDSVSMEESLPAGKFSIQSGDKEKSFDFNGGSIGQLEKLIRAGAGNEFGVSNVRVDSDRMLIALQANKEGKAGAFKFTDPDSLLQKIGLSGERMESSSQTHVVNFTPASVQKKVPESQFRILNQNKMEIQSGGVTLHLVSGVNEKQSYRTLSYKEKFAPVVKNEQDQNKTPEQNLKAGPDIDAKVGDVKLQGYDPDRVRITSTEEKIAPPEFRAEPYQLKIQIKNHKTGALRDEAVTLNPADANEARVIDLTSILKEEETPVSVSVDLPETESITLSDMVLKGEQKKEVKGALRETTPAADAELKINGVTVSRPSNQGISDIIQGASLNLHRVTHGAVTVKAQVNADDVVKKIQDWIIAYNELMKFCRENSKITSGEFDEDPYNLKDRGMQIRRPKAGIFATDSTVRQLVMQIRSASSSSYPSNTDPSFHVLSDVGVTTGEPGKEWQEVRFGYLQLDENRLRQALDQSPEAVKELFASDTNEDANIDNGVAYRMGEDLQPYIRVSGGVIASRINLLKTKLADNKERMSRKEVSIKKMEDNLRRKFGRMENAVQENRAMGNYLKNNIGGGAAQQ